MYENYFGLSRRPFYTVPDPFFFFKSSQHEEALAHLLYGIESAEGFIVLTGEAGTGKTTLCRLMLRQLEGTIAPVLIVNPPATVIELLKSILDRLGWRTGATTRHGLLEVLQARLWSEADKPIVIIIDEAQNLSEEVLEELRLLSNFETADRKLVLLVLLGQPGLLQKLSRESLKQFSQRIAIYYNLEPLNLTDTARYIEFRLNLAGSSGRLSFTARAVAALHKATLGIPRMINIICDKVLLGAYAGQTFSITRALVQEAIGDTCYGSIPVMELFRQKTKPAGSERFPPRLSLLPAALLAVITAAAFFYFMQTRVAPEPPPSKGMHHTAAAPAAEAAAAPDTPQPGIAAAAADNASAAPGPVLYTIQLGSFYDSNIAREFADMLQAEGYEPTVLCVDNETGGSVYLVRIGRYALLADAEQSASAVSLKRKASALITRY